MAQLTKVVVHLTSRNDESELQYLRLSEAAEHDMRPGRDALRLTTEMGMGQD